MKKSSTGTENKVRCYFGVTSPAVHRNDSKFITAPSLSKLHDDTIIVAAKEWRWLIMRCWSLYRTLLYLYGHGCLYSVDWTVGLDYGTGLRESCAHHFRWLTWQEIYSSHLLFLVSTQPSFGCDFVHDCALCTWPNVDFRGKYSHTHARCCNQVSERCCFLSYFCQVRLRWCNYSADCIIFNMDCLPHTNYSLSVWKQQ